MPHLGYENKIIKVTQSSPHEHESSIAQTQFQCSIKAVSVSDSGAAKQPSNRSTNIYKKLIKLNQEQNYKSQCSGEQPQ